MRGVLVTGAQPKRVAVRTSRPRPSNSCAGMPHCIPSQLLRGYCNTGCPHPPCTFVDALGHWPANRWAVRVFSCVAPRPCHIPRAGVLQGKRACRGPFVTKVLSKVPVTEVRCSLDVTLYSLRCQLLFRCACSYLGHEVVRVVGVVLHKYPRVPCTNSRASRAG